MNVFKKRRRNPKTGKVELSRSYYFKHRFAGDDKPTERSLGVTDKEVALTRAREIVLKEERRRQGLWVNEAETIAAGQKLLDLVDEYGQTLKDDGRKRDHYRKVIQRLHTAFNELCWKKLADISKSEFRAWIRASNLKPKTRQHYQSAAVAFSRWLNEEGMLPESPLDGLPRVKGIAASQAPAVALTEDEAARLLSAVPRYRRDFYSIMLYTGLRAIEVGRLKVANILSRDGKLFIRLDPEQSKAKRLEWQEVPDFMGHTIGRLTTGRAPEARLISKGQPTRKTFQRDLRSAGIEAERSHGARITKHALRRTYITWTHGITESPAVRQKLARHVTEYLTDKVYTDRLALNLHEVVDRLPDVASTATVSPNGETGGDSGGVPSSGDAGRSKVSSVDPMDSESGSGTQSSRNRGERRGERNPTGDTKNLENPGVRFPPAPFRGSVLTNTRHC